MFDEEDAKARQMLKEEFTKLPRGYQVIKSNEVTPLKLSSIGRNEIILLGKPEHRRAYDLRA